MIEPFAPLYPWLREALDKIRIRCPNTDYRFPACPKCSKTMEPVRQVGGHLSREQFDSVKAGDWMCGCHNNDRGRAPRGYYWEHELPPTTWIDLRHGPTRYAVLRALADVGHSRPWALGAPWSPLADEQAGRATAAILRAVGEDSSKLAGVVPVCVLSPWLLDQHGQSIREPLGTGLWSFVNDHGWYISEYRNGRHHRDITGSHEPEATPDNTGEPGRLAADNAARSLGCLMIEDLTPT